MWAFCLDPSPFHNWVICFLDSVFACLFVLILLTHLCQVYSLPRFSHVCEFLLHLLDCFLSCAGLFKFCEAYKLVQPLWKSVWRFFKNLKINLPYDQAIPLHGIREKYSTFYFMDTCPAMFFAVPFTITRKCKRSKCPPANEWLMKL